MNCEAERSELKESHMSESEWDEMEEESESCEEKISDWKDTSDWEEASEEREIDEVQEKMVREDRSCGYRIEGAEPGRASASNFIFV